MGDHINWSEEEFKAYLCLYAAESNFEIHADEKSLIDSKFSAETIEKIKEETDDLNDYQRPLEEPKLNQVLNFFLNRLALGCQIY